MGRWIRGQDDSGAAGLWVGETLATSGAVPRRRPAPAFTRYTVPVPSHLVFRLRMLHHRCAAPEVLPCASCSHAHPATSTPGPAPEALSRITLLVPSHSVSCPIFHARPCPNEDSPESALGLVSDSLKILVGLFGVEPQLSDGGAHPLSSVLKINEKHHQEAPFQCDVDPLHASISAPETTWHQ